MNLRGALACLALTFAGCTSSAITAQLEACGFVGEGEIGPVVTSRFYQPTDCYRACLGAASCEELEATLCGASIELLRRCDGQCAHRCDDGALIGVEDVCDGFAQCAGGEDEAGCPTVACDDGTMVSGAACDGRWHCADGSDERDCPSCEATWGGTIPLVSAGRCDGYVQCEGGEDERGCPTFVCDDGTTRTHPEGYSPRCDGWSFCPDGSDERGCASLTLSCAP